MIVHDSQVKALQCACVDLSFRVSRFAVPVKPFIRFGQGGDHKTLSRRFWDFDYGVQQRLLDALRQVASADEIAALGVERWKHNLVPLLAVSQAALRAARLDSRYPDQFDVLPAKFAILVESLPPGANVLYVGAGSGMECLQFAARGLRLVGIDPIAPLLAVGREWAALLKREAAFACMDVTAAGFKSGVFDGFTLEFYGSWPARSQVLKTQRELARLLKPEGLGFITANRKRYASYWYLMGSEFPPAMLEWLVPYSQLDFLFSNADDSTARLMYGLYNESHTVASLAAELAWTFDVVECREDPDPRYLTAVVRRRAGVDLNTPLPGGDSAARPDLTPEALAGVKETLRLADHLAGWLEGHSRQVGAYFERGGAARDCLTAIQPDLPALTSLLEALLPS